MFCSKVPPKSNILVSRVLVIDHHPIIREGIIAVLSEALKGMDIRGCGDFSEAMFQVESQAIDLVVTDFRVQGDTALSFLKCLEHSELQTRCLILSGYDEIQVGYPCIRAGASGFIGKSASVACLVGAIQSIHAGRHYFSERLSRALMENQGAETKTSPGTHLTARELQIFALVAEGLGVSNIALKLGISVKTVETHRENIKNKLGLENSAQLTATAVRWLDDSSIVI